MNKRILVTRPAAQNAGFVQALAQRGDVPLIMPLLAIETFTIEQHTTECEAIKGLIQRLDEYQHIIFISTNAVAAAGWWIDRYWPQLPVRQHCYAIGQATAEQMAKVLGMMPLQAHGAMNSEALLQQAELQAIQGEKILIVRGQGGREQLRQVLQQRGARVDYCEVYRRLPIRYENKALATLLASGIDVLTITSGETLQLLLEQAVNDGIKDNIQRLPIVVPGQRIAALAKRSGFQQVIIAENAGVAAMLQACG
jgi:uroporphyrinogen-III synthase